MMWTRRASANDDRANIFSRHARAWTRPRAAAGGAGLGLAISWQIMRHHGGTLEFVSADGPGACFRVSLGAVQTASAPGR
jgi:two-component system, OmpR family, sensor kinase